MKDLLIKHRNPIGGGGASSALLALNAELTADAVDIVFKDTEIPCPFIFSRGG